MALPRTKVIKAPKDHSPVIAAQAAEAAQNHRRSNPMLKTIAEKVAGDFLMHVNYMYQGAKEIYPEQPKMWTVDKYFPLASGGPLFVDEPMRASDLLLCEQKAKGMKELGYRYLILKKDMTELDALEQIA